jgi:hypothetical protein
MNILLLLYCAICLWAAYQIGRAVEMHRFIVRERKRNRDLQLRLYGLCSESAQELNKPEPVDPSEPDRSDPDWWKRQDP